MIAGPGSGDGTQAAVASLRPAAGDRRQGLGVFVFGRDGCSLCGPAAALPAHLAAGVLP